MDSMEICMITIKHLLEDTETGERIRPGYDGIAEFVKEMQQAS